MHVSLERSSALPHADMVGKKDAASQTECCSQVTMTTGRTVSCAQPSLRSCPLDTDTITVGKSLSDGVNSARGALQASLQGSNRLIRNVAGFAIRQMTESTQFPQKQCLILLGVMPALAGAHPVNTTPSFTDPATNLNSTSEPTSFDNREGIAIAITFAGIFTFVGLCYVTAYCAHCYNEYQRFKYQNPDASRFRLLKAAFNNPNDTHSTRSFAARYHLPVPLAQIPPAPMPAPPAPRAPAPTTCEQGTQTPCHQGTQTESTIDDPVPQEQPPTYQQATACLENSQSLDMDLL
ncbi:hypothetical protein [Endozoicomonas sp. ONNA2]|uniref:hypothetical protein n=1 Tax=Endozoicomonas sp. ONNA2 TaxID=2828741 RepID=UPI0021484737|nr:hypothetical protein [Endozoicomonas sp. ONNA2]